MDSNGKKTVDNGFNFNVAIVRLSPFVDVTKSITHQFLYGECRRALPDNCIDFFFFPTESQRKHNKPILSLRQKKSFLDFDLIYVSNSFTNEIINLPWMLLHSNIPCSSAERKNKNVKPIIIMGGSNAMASQSILFSDNDALVDAVFFGEGEMRMSEIIRQLLSEPFCLRREKLNSLQGKVTGLKVFDAGYAKIEKAIYQGTDHELLANSEQYIFDSEEASTARLLISYGCPSFCTFCFEGWERKPYREVPLDELLAAAKSLRKKTGADKLEITAFNFNTHTDVTALMTELSKIYFQVNFMSQRADILAENPQLLHFEVASGKKQYTIGVEGISERLRSYFNKNLNEETLLKTVTMILKEPVREIKLFYIISGLETNEDCEEFRTFLSKVDELRHIYNDGMRILCSFGLLVRMPFTPLRYEKLLMTEEEWKPVVFNIKSTTENAGYEFRLTYPYEEYFFQQSLALTKIKCASVLVEMSKHGFVYDKELTSGAWAFFKERIPVTKEFCEEKKSDYNFAYDFIDTHTTQNILYKRFVEAKNRTQTPMCIGLPCHGCGSCNESQRKFLTEHKINMPNLDDARKIASLVKSKAQAKPVFIEVEIPKEYSSSHQESKRAYVMRKLFNQFEGSVTLIMTVRDMLFGGKSFENNLRTWYGKTVYAVYPFCNEQIPLLTKLLQSGGYKVTSEMPNVQNISADINLNSDTAESAEKIAGDLINAQHIQYTLSRKNEISYFDITSKSLKKKIILSCKSSEEKINLNCTCKIDFTVLSKIKCCVELNFM